MTALVTGLVRQLVTPVVTPVVKGLVLPFLGYLASRYQSELHQQASLRGYGYYTITLPETAPVVPAQRLAV